MDVKSLLGLLREEFKMPAEADKYNGKAPEWIVLNYSDDRPVVYGDDTDIVEQITIQVHMFCFKNVETKKKALRRSLRRKGFLILSTSQFYENDTGLTHIVVECQTECEVDD